MRRPKLLWAALWYTIRYLPQHCLQVKPDDPNEGEKLRTMTRNVGGVIGALFFAYALFGYLTDDILIFSGKGRGSPLYAHGKQAAWAALGYVSFAVAAAIIAVGGFVKPIKRIESSSSNSTEVARPQLGIQSSALLAVVFVIIGIVLVGFRTTS